MITPDGERIHDFRPIARTERLSLFEQYTIAALANMQEEIRNMSASVTTQVEAAAARITASNTALTAAVGAVAAEIADLHSQLAAALPPPGTTVTQEDADSLTAQATRLETAIQGLVALANTGPVVNPQPSGSPPGLVFDSTMNLWKDPTTGAHWNAATQTMEGGVTQTPPLPDGAPADLKFDSATGLWMDTQGGHWDTTTNAMVPAAPPEEPAGAPPGLVLNTSTGHWTDPNTGLVWDSNSNTMVPGP